MNCRNVQSSLSAHLDGFLSGERRRGILSHLDGCRGCRSQLAQMARVRAALRGLPVNAPPENLGIALHVLASKERARVLARQRRLERVAERMRLWADNLMRPLALPFAGGLVSAILLFSMLLPTFALHRVTGGDIPVALFTEPSIKAQMEVGGFDNGPDFVVEVIVDNQGWMVDYNLPKGSKVADNPELRRALENKLLFTQFRPATMFGQPTYGKVYVSFQCQSIDVKS
jgi:hypothetical protein